MRKLHLNRLKEGFPGISEVAGMFLLEALAYCLFIQGHQQGVNLKIEGDFKAEFSLYWDYPINDRILRTWEDQKEAVEYAATAIGVLIIIELTEYTILRRLAQDKLADYQLIEKLPNKSNSNVAKNHLEVSGIMKETKGNTINFRINAKKKKILENKKHNESVIVFVAKFDIPKAKMIQL